MKQGHFEEHWLEWIPAGTDATDGEKGVMQLDASTTARKTVNCGRLKEHTGSNRFSFPKEGL